MQKLGLTPNYQQYRALHGSFIQGDRVGIQQDEALMGCLGNLLPLKALGSVPQPRLSVLHNRTQLVFFSPTWHSSQLTIALTLG